MFEKIKNMFRALTGQEPVVESAVEAEEGIQVTVDASIEPVVAAEAVEAVAPYSRSNDRHVVPEGKAWMIVSPGNPVALEHHEKKKDAVAAGKAMCKLLKSELFIHGKNGKIQDRCSFGGDSPDRLG